VYTSYGHAKLLDLQHYLPRLQHHHIVHVDIPSGRHKLQLQHVLLPDNHQLHDAAPIHYHDDDDFDLHYHFILWHPDPAKQHMRRQVLRLFL